MGKVFTWQEVAERRIPVLGDFTLVLQALRNTLSRSPSIFGALVCGSVIRGDHNRRSDLDCVVIYDAKKSRDAYAIMQSLSVYAHRLHVPLTFISSSTRLTVTRMHHFGPSFVEHIGFSLGSGLIKGRPLELLSPSVSRKAGIEEYLRFKMHYLEAHWAAYPTGDDQNKAEFLKKTLEAPLHVARKTLSWFGPLEGDSKLQIRQQYASRMPAKMVAVLGELVHLDHEYSNELARQLEKPDQANYNTFWGYLEEQVPQVLEFVTSNLEHVDEAAR